MDIQGALASGCETIEDIATAINQSVKYTRRAVKGQWVAGRVNRQVYPSRADTYTINRNPPRRTDTYTINPNPTPPRKTAEVADTLPAKVLQCFEAGVFYTALDIAKAVGLITAKEVNPTLYALQNRGAIVITKRTPPLLGFTPIWTRVNK